MNGFEPIPRRCLFCFYYFWLSVHSDKDEKPNNLAAAGSGDGMYQGAQVKASSSTSDSTLKGNKKALNNGTLSGRL